MKIFCGYFARVALRDHQTKPRKHENHFSMPPKNTQSKSSHLNSINNRLLKKESIYAAIIEHVALASLTSFQKFTGFVIIGTLVTDGSLAFAHVSTALIAMVNAPAFFLTFIVGTKELKNVFTRRKGPPQSRSNKTS